jgi:hypothetical protein
VGVGQLGLLGSALVFAFAFVLTLALVLLWLELQDFERFRVDLGFESAALGIGEANFITTIVDLQPLYKPALGCGHLPHGVARLPALEWRIAIVLGQGGQRGKAQQHHQQPLAQRAGVFHGSFLSSRLSIRLGVDGMLKKPWAFRPDGVFKFDSPLKAQ